MSNTPVNDKPACCAIGEVAGPPKRVAYIRVVGGGYIRLGPALSTAIEQLLGADTNLGDETCEFVAPTKHHIGTKCLGPAYCDCDDCAFVSGWQAADEALAHQLPGYRDYSQGTRPFDRGWNRRLDSETPARIVGTSIEGRPRE